MYKYIVLVLQYNDEFIAHENLDHGRPIIMIWIDGYIILCSRFPRRKRVVSLQECTSFSMNTSF